MIQGPEPGEYRGLTLDEQRQMNEMYRDLNSWNLRAIRILEAREAEECSCGWFSVFGDPRCAVHNTESSHD